ncbi:MAG: prolyl oligopeptidase family serine peptidase [Candidatus Cloacimonetes bacterium]|jgi:dipeptidyl aminopeptidase/acylaminoacyl peptidase|nr:prolyl oligopeptidase family serine peptidase [Candidatus Cloacimonadota bacterium]
MNKILFIFILLGVLMTLNADTGYKLPADEIVKIYDTPRNPYIQFIQFEYFGLEMSYQLHQTLEQLAEPSLKLAGEDISKRLNAPMENYPTNIINIFDLKNKLRIPIQLPDDAKIRNIVISNDHKKAALLNETENGIQIIIANLKNGECKVYSNYLINDILEDGIICWLNDNENILLKVIPEDRGNEPVKPDVPESPVIEETYGKKSITRTYQNLLRDKHDETLFDYYFTSQIISLNTGNGKIKKIGKPVVFSEVKPSPDNEYLLIEQIQRPYSYLLPYYRFPKVFEIWDTDGKLVKLLLSRPLQDEIPIGGTLTGPRKFQWQPFKDASLIWVEALDEGDPENKVEHRDKIIRLTSPRTEKIEELFRTEHRFSSINWSEVEDELIYYEYDRDRLWKKGWLFEIGSKPRLIYDLSSRDKYNDPEKLVQKKTKCGENVFIKIGDCVYYQNSTGATAQGDYPYLAKFNLLVKEKEVLFRSRKALFETFRSFANNELNKIIIRSEDQNTPPNYFSIDLKTGKREEITNYPNNFSKLAELKKDMVKYTRKDGIPLSGELYLPTDYQNGDRLPLVINAYPQEFADSTTAGQITTTSNKFSRFSRSSVRYFALLGYAVLTKASIPIVGDPETVNETFIEQTVNSVEAAIKYLDERGIIDPDRVGITGHSYGAFMVANVLAHSDLCAAGIARSGAYNRTLTPFGFQSERRTFWKAKDFYMEVSPFAHAEKINEPILLIHGEDDPNSGTYPMQSKRFYQALKGNSGIAKLVILPYEGHNYRARRSGLHVLAEMIEWFDRFVKDKK